MLTPVANVNIDNINSAKNVNIDSPVTTPDDTIESVKQKLHDDQSKVVDQAGDQVKGAEDKVDSLKKEKETVESDKKDVEDKIIEMSEEDSKIVSDINKELDNKKNENLDKNHSVDENKKIIEDAKNKISDNDKKISDKESQIDSLNKEISGGDDTSDEIKSLNDKISELGDRISATNEDKLASIEKLESEKESKDSLASDLKTFEESSDLLKKTLDEIASDINGHGSSLKGKKDELSKLKNLIEKAKSDSKNVKNRISSIEKEISDCEQKIKKIEQEEGKDSPEVKALRKQYQDAIADYVNLRNKTKVLESKLSQAQDAYDKAFREYRDHQNDESNPTKDANLALYDYQAKSKTLKKLIEKGNIKGFIDYLEKKGLAPKETINEMRELLNKTDKNGNKVIHLGDENSASNIFNVLDGIYEMKYANLIRKAYFEKYYQIFHGGKTESTPIDKLIYNTSLNTTMNAIYNADKNAYLFYGHDGDIFNASECISYGYTTPMNAMDGYVFQEFGASLKGVLEGEITWEDLINRTPEYKRWVASSRSHQNGHLLIVLSDMYSSVDGFIPSIGAASAYKGRVPYNAFDIDTFYKNDSSASILSIDDLQNLIIDYLDDCGLWNDEVKEAFGQYDSSALNYMRKDLFAQTHELNQICYKISGGKIFFDNGDTPEDFSGVGKKEQLFEALSKAGEELSSAKEQMAENSRNLEKAYDLFNDLCQKLNEATGEHHSFTDVVKYIRDHKTVRLAAMRGETKETKEILQARLAKLNEEKAHCEKKVAELDSTIKDAERESSRLESSIEDEESKIESLNSQKDEVEHRISTYDAKISSIKVKIDKALKNISYLESHIGDCESQIAEYRKESSQINDKIAELDKKAAEINKIKGQISALKSSISELKKENSVLQGTINDKEADNMILTNEIKANDKIIANVEENLSNIDNVDLSVFEGTPFQGLMAHLKETRSSIESLVKEQRDLSDSIVRIDAEMKTASEELSNAVENYNKQVAILNKIDSIKPEESDNDDLIGETKDDFEKINAAKAEKIKEIEDVHLESNVGYTFESYEKAKTELEKIKKQAVDNVLSCTSVEAVEKIHVPSADMVIQYLEKMPEIPSTPEMGDKPVKPEDKPEVPEVKPETEDQKEESKEESKDDQKGDTDKNHDDSRDKIVEEKADEVKNDSVETHTDHAETPSTSDVSMFGVFSTMVAGIASIAGAFKRKNQ